MARLRKTRGKSPAKCNAAPPDPPRHSLPWMPNFLALALESGDVDSAIDKAGISRGTYLRGRLKDPAFDEDCGEVDLIERLAARSAVQSAAARGEVKALRLLKDGFGDVGRAVSAEAEALPHMLRIILADYRAGRVSAFVLAAIEAAYALAREIEVRGKGPTLISSSSRFSAADVASLWDRRSYGCPDCGSIAYRDADAVGATLNAWQDADDSRWSSDNGWRCPRCGARRGLPWSPASKPAGRFGGRADPNRLAILPPAEGHDDSVYRALIEAKERALNGGRTLRELSPYHRKGGR